ARQATAPGRLPASTGGPQCPASSFVREGTFMRRRASKAISVATILSLLLVSMAAGTTSAADRGSGAARARAEKAQHDKTVAYWAAERIASAQPRDFVRTGTGKIVPKAKPGGGSGGTSGGASYSGGGPVVQRTGKVLFTMGGSNWVCSATVLDDPGTD